MPFPRLGHPRWRGRTTADHAFASGFHPITIDTVDYDDVAGWSAGHYTVDRSGLWLLEAHAGWTGAVTSVSASVLWSVNGVDTDARHSPAVGGDSGAAGTWVLQLAAGDVLIPRGRRSPTTGSTLKADRSGAHIVRIGPVRYV